MKSSDVRLNCSWKYC